MEAKKVANVTDQTRVCPCGTLMHDPTIRGKGNRFLFTGSNLDGGAGSTPAQSPVLPQDPALPLPPPGYRPQSCPEVPHILICS